MTDRLRNRVSTFLNYSGMTKSQFAKNVDLCPSTIGQWLTEQRIISTRAENRINDFMSEYATRISEIVNN